MSVHAHDKPCKDKTCRCTKHPENCCSPEDRAKKGKKK